MPFSFYFRLTLAFLVFLFLKHLADLPMSGPLTPEDIKFAEGADKPLKPQKPFISVKAIRSGKAMLLTTAMIAPLFIYIKFWIVPEAENRYESMWEAARNRGYVYDPSVRFQFTYPLQIVTVL